MADLINGLASAVGGLITAVETVLVTQTLTGNSAQATTSSTSTSTTPIDITTSAQQIQSDASPATVVSVVVLTTATPTPTTSVTISSIASRSLLEKSTIALPSATNTSSTKPLPTVLGQTVTSAGQSPTASFTSDSVQSTQTDHKTAIIGGIVGALAGLILVALIVFFCCLRRRRRKHDSEIVEQFRYQEPWRPPPYRMPAGMSEHKFGAAAPLPRPEARSMKSFQSHNGTLVNVSLDHFVRPFGEQEGYRDTMPPGMLRCTNPDRSLPVTPQPNRMSDPFHRAKPIMQTTIVEGEPHNHEWDDLRKPPIVRVHDVDSKEMMASAYAPSFRSYPSIHTPSPRTSKWMTEPLPPLPVAATAIPRQTRPALRPLHSVASRTLSSIGNALRLSAGGKDSERQSNGHLAVDHPTGNESWRVSAASDPFDLDSPTRRSAVPAWQRMSNGQPKHFTPYEGT